MTDEAAAVETEEQGTEDAAAVADALNTGGDERPDWLLDRYMTEGRSIEEATAEQAKGYNEIRSKLGAFTGAPDEYEISVSDELKEKGFDIEDGDPLVEEVQKVARDMNMSQDGITKLVELYGTVELAKAELEGERVAEEMKALGKNADQRVANVRDWAKANMTPEQVEGLEQATTTAAAVMAVERLIAMTRGGSIVGDGAGAPSATGEEVRKMQFEKDEHGNRRIQTDPEFRKRYEALRDQVYGTEENRIVVGG